MQFNGLLRNGFQDINIDLIYGLPKQTIEEIKENITLATRFLYRLIESDDIKLAFRKDFKMHAAYHSACHMEKMGMGYL